MPAAKSGTKKAPRAKKPPKPPKPDTLATILAWEDDPFVESAAVPVDGTPVRRPVPDLAAGPLPVKIQGRKAPAPKEYPPGTPGFRYWTAADALRRGLDFWTAVLPPGLAWYGSVGKILRVNLDAGEDLNAYYTREGLEFFHARVGGREIHSGESPDVLCHELGHAVLDALRPQLFHAASLEAASFHEAFGDISTLLSSLQLPSIRNRALQQTGGRLFRTSSHSRIAEQLGWAIRQVRPDAVDPDCLRNTVNAFFYLDPARLPPDGPSGQLSSKPHSFCRVFSGAFLEALGGMLKTLGATEPNLLRASLDAGRLLVDAVRRAPVVPAYYSQVAAALLDAERARFKGLYRDALKSAFVRHGVLSLSAAAAQSLLPPEGVAYSAAPDLAPDLPVMEVMAGGLGLGVETLLVHAPSEPAGLPGFQAFPASASAPHMGQAPPHTQSEDARFFLEDLLRRGHVDLGDQGDAEARVAHPYIKKTHRLVRVGGGLVLERLRFDCGFDCE